MNSLCHYCVAMYACLIQLGLEFDERVRKVVIENKIIFCEEG